MDRFAPPTHYVEQAIEGLADYIAIKVEIANQWGDHGVLRPLIELFDDPHILHRLMNNGSERLRQFRGTGFLK